MGKKKYTPYTPGPDQHGYGEPKTGVNGINARHDPHETYRPYYPGAGGDQGRRTGHLSNVEGFHVFRDKGGSLVTAEAGVQKGGNSAYSSTFMRVRPDDSVTPVRSKGLGYKDVDHPVRNAMAADYGRSDHFRAAVSQAREIWGLG